MPPQPAIALFYFAYLGALGVFLPFFSLYLADVGFLPSEITRVYAILPVLGVVAPPLFGAAADALRVRVWLLRGTSAAALVAFAGLLLTTNGRPGIYALVILFSFFRAPITSLADAVTHEVVRVEGGSYGRLRLFGSLGFLLAALGAGLLGTPQIVVATTAGLALAAACAWAMPAPPSVPTAGFRAAWLRLVGGGSMWLLLGAIVLAQLAGSTYDSCFSLHLQRLHLSSRFIGLAWATGVLAEVVLLAFSGRLIARFGAAPLLVFSLATAAVRWFLLGRVQSPAVILALQPLHGVTFGFFYVSATTLIRDRAEPETATAAQGLFAAAISLGSVVGFLVAGDVLERWGSVPLFSASAACALGATALALAYATRLR